MVSEPIKYGERGILARAAPKLSDIFTQKRNLHTDAEDTERGDKASKPEHRKAYRNSHGEEIVFNPCDPPLGYVFVPSGNVFITRRCRKLAQQKLYAVYRAQIRKQLAAQIGLYVPRDTFEKVKSEFEEKRARIDENLWRALDKNYPHISLADKNELHRLNSQPQRLRSNLDGITIYAYVRDRYTPFKSLDPFGSRDTEAIARVHRRVQEILASWRGEDSRENESSEKSSSSDP